MRKKNLCRHCGDARISRPRGLCWSCYYTPGVRELYLRDAGCGRRAIHGERGGCYELPAFPTNAWPGTDEKVKVLEERALLGTALFHPEDTTFASARWAL